MTNPSKKAVAQATSYRSLQCSFLFCNCRKSGEKPKVIFQTDRIVKGAIFQHWKWLRKLVWDNRNRNAQICPCCHCLRAFHGYPEGVGQADQTQQLRKLADQCAC